MIEGEEEWEVEGILKAEHKGRNRQVQYLVSWKGYPASENSWVAHQDLNAPKLLKEFYQKHPQAIKPTPDRR